MIEFVLVFSMMKLARTIIAATFFMAAALAVCRFCRSRSWRLKLGMLSIVPLACFMGYSKVFYIRSIILVIVVINKIATKEMAALYFGCAGLLAARYVYIHKKLGRRLRSMRHLPEHEYPEYLKKSHGPAIKVYLSDDDNAGPFAGGVVHPYIVVPSLVKDSLAKEEFAAVLYHEAVHIRMGHILILNIYSLLKIIWWIHPLIYLCDAKLRENIEYSSDEGSVVLGCLNTYEYGNVILKTLQAQNVRKSRVCIMKEGITAFSADCYETLKRRVENLGMIKGKRVVYQEYQKEKKCLHMRIAAAVVMTAAVITATSYPRYTKLNEIAVYDDQLKPVIFDLAAEGIYADASDDEFHISAQEFDKLAARHKLHGEYVVFSYGAIMKLPGIGGGGQAAMVSMSDPSDVFLLGSEKLADQIKIFALKYLM